MTDEQIERLERLGKLRDQGILSEDEFQEQKTSVLRNPAPAVLPADPYANVPPAAQGSSVPLFKDPTAPNSQRDTRIWGAAERVDIPEKKTHDGKIFVYTIAAVVLISIFVPWFGRQYKGTSGTGGSGSLGAPSDAEAFSACRDFVTRHLKAPASADFASMDDSEMQSLGNRKFRVISRVDVENSSGENLRTSFTCETTRAAISNKWTLDRLATDP